VKVAIACPRRPDYGRRDELWKWVRPWWEDHTGWTVYEGVHPVEDGDRFNIAAARNRAAAAAGEWDVIFLLDADVILADPAQAFRAVEVAHATGRWTAAHDRWRGLDRTGSDRVMSGWCGDWGKYAQRTIPWSFSCALAIPRPLWEQTRGQDERHVGWGFEDMSFMWASKALTGLERVHGDLFHLWHPRSKEKEKGQPAYQANKTLSRRYRDARHDPDATLAILAER
jgi:glycosyltransferase involved in cell wall biosynthesis